MAGNLIAAGDLRPAGVVLQRVRAEDSGGDRGRRRSAPPKQYIQPDKFAVVVVGDLAKIEKPIRAANLGPVRVVTVDEILK